MSKFTKEKFDAIIKSNLTDCMPRVSKDNFGYEINDSFVNLPLYLANKMHELI